MWLACLAVVDAGAKLFPMDLAGMVGHSDEILVARVVDFRASRISNSFFGDARIARLHVESPVLNGQAKGMIEVLYFPDFGEAPRIDPGDRVVAFLARCGGHYEPVQGYRGMVHLDRDNLAHTSVIDGERDLQKLSRFRRRIRTVGVVPDNRVKDEHQFRCWSALGDRD